MRHRLLLPPLPLLLLKRPLLPSLPPLPRLLLKRPPPPKLLLSRLPRRLHLLKKPPPLPRLPKLLPTRLALPWPSVAVKPLLRLRVLPSLPLLPLNLPRLQRLPPRRKPSFTARSILPNPWN